MNNLIIFINLQFSSIVVACNRNPVTDIVQALDTYNTPPKERDNKINPFPNVIQLSANYSDGKITCRYPNTHT